MTGPYPTPAPDGGRHNPNPGSTAKYPGTVCARDVTCDPYSLKKQQSTPPPPSPSPTPDPSAEQISKDSTFNVLQFNANGIGNKLTELLGVVLERN